jgi:hypothetical protein
MAKPATPNPQVIPTTAVITWEEQVFKKKVHSKTINIPAFWKDEYGHSCACLDGKTTILVKEARWQPKGVPGLETYDYVSSTVASPKSTYLSAEQFQQALDRVEAYLHKVMKLEIFTRNDVQKEVVRG